MPVNKVVEDVDMIDVNDEEKVKPPLSEEEESQLKNCKESITKYEKIIEELSSAIIFIERGVKQNDDRLIGRALRQYFSTLRRKSTREIIRKSLQKSYQSNEQSEVKSNIENLLSMLPESQYDNQIETNRKIVVDLEQKKQKALEELQKEKSKDKKEEQKSENTMEMEDKKESKTESKKAANVLPIEVELFYKLIILVLLIDNKKVEDSVKFSTELVHYLKKFNQRTLSQIASKIYFYYSYSYELNNDLLSIRSDLLSEFQSASLRLDHYKQATLMNLLLRNYISFHSYDQANKLIKSAPQIDFHSNSQLARYFYYKGRIQSIHLDYSDAYECLMTAIRKAPGVGAKGFRLAATKLAIIVQMLMGEIPERTIFTQNGFRKELRPYFELTRHVRVGDLAEFREVVEKYKNEYSNDNNYRLIQRIRQNVIRTGLKKISFSYSKISFVDVCEKLNLDNAEDVECIVAKAIKDGIIDATINHEEQYIKSKETIDVYSTSEPCESFNKRIDYLLKIHNESLKAMRFPPSKKRQEELNEVYNTRKRQDEELAELVEDDDEEDMDDEF